MTVRAEAHPNIALVKYWGKRDTALNLPAVPSLSITLNTLSTTTALQVDSALEEDECVLDGNHNSGVTARVSHCLDTFRRLSGSNDYARVSSENNFPTAAGLASSASGFAALVVAANEAYSCGLDARQLSGIARAASGSAGRSLFGGFAEQSLGTAADGSDAIALPVAPAHHWPLEVVIAITSSQAKKTGSSEGMQLSAKSSAFYPGWLADASSDLEQAREAVHSRDFGHLATVAESSCLKMHAVMMASQPGLVYWNGATVDCIHRIRELRNTGTGTFFTIDAGPQLKAVCLPENVASVAASLKEIPGVEKIIHCGLGEGARLLET